MHRIDLNRWKHTEVYCIRHFNENSFQTRSPTARCCLCRCCCSTNTKPKHWLQKKKKIPSEANRHDEIKLSVFACLLLLLKSFCFSLGLSFGYIVFVAAIICVQFTVANVDVWSQFNKQTVAMLKGLYTFDQRCSLRIDTHFHIFDIERLIGSYCLRSRFCMQSNANVFTNAQWPNIAMLK